MLRTLQSYREALKTDPELSRLYTEARQAVITRDWAEQLSITLSGAAAKLLALVGGAQSSAPENIQAVTGAVLSFPPATGIHALARRRGAGGLEFRPPA
ncbi:hypothetical protein [Deinococcus marmoris]|uniref:Uncharacterized protein n=1 Tax=Deinococcus marmoris TaxID=249408 RepID=A0A1U7P1C3_9DEIO|nr:hypothetical protein [Deinococcus marmoris]OLV18964.1 hypothetical protein BOO71_0004297 [Deinococcus marmoris]